MLYLVKVSQLSDGGDVRPDDLPLSVRGAGQGVTADVLADSRVQVGELAAPAQAGEVLLTVRLLLRQVSLVRLVVTDPAVTKSQSSQLGLSSHLCLWH